jgi:hypothetical protein
LSIDRKAKNEKKIQVFRFIHKKDLVIKINFFFIKESLCL